MYMGNNAWDDYTETDAAMQDLINDAEEEDDFEDVGPASDLPVTYPIGIDDDFDDDPDDDYNTDNFWDDEYYEEPESMR